MALLDISGSMSQYTRLFLHFLHAVTDERKRVTTFLFGTRLTNVTRAIRQRDPTRRSPPVRRMWSTGRAARASPPRCAHSTSNGRAACSRRARWCCQTLFQKGQRDAWVMFECGVAVVTVSLGSDFFTASPDSDLLKNEVRRRLRQTTIIPAVYNHKRTSAWFAGTVVFVVAKDSRISGFMPIRISMKSNVEPTLSRRRSSECQITTSPICRIILAKR